MELELSWTTFLLEIVNFLILVWILKRFLYKPVLNVIDRRRAEIEATLREADSRQAEAGEMKARYEERLDAWEKEKAEAYESLRADLQAEQTRAMTVLQQDLAKAREKEEALSQRRTDELTRKSEAVAIERATRFAARLFSRFAGPELEARLVDLVIEDLGRLSDDRLAALRAAGNGTEEPVAVHSAFPLNSKQQQALHKALSTLPLGTDRQMEFAQDPDLVAGLSISVGPWVLRANLRDELRFFAGESNGTV